MRYVCLHCGHRWDGEGGAPDGKVRCPSCLRVTGIEKLAEAEGHSRAARRRWLVPGVLALAIAALAGGYAVWRSRSPAQVGDEVPLRPLERDVLLAHLRRLGVDARGVVALLEPDEGLEALAREVTRGRGSAFEMAEAVYEWVRGRAAQRAFVRWSLGVPRETPVGVAGTVRTWIQEDGARRRLYPLEAAALMVALLRSAGVDAMLAEAWAFPGDRSPPDPSGHFGYFVVAVYAGEAGASEPRFYDPWGGHEVAPDEDHRRVLTDVQALGAALHLRAIHLLVRESDAARAMEVSRDALRLDPRSPSARSVRAAILVAAGGAAEGVQEFEAAKQLRADAPRHQQIAGVYLAQGDFEGARRELTAALEQMPDYAAAHAALGAVHLAESEPDLARESLETAQRLDPDLHTLTGLWAGYYAATGDLDRAVQSAQSAVERNPWDVQTRLMAARIYRQAARYDAMRREAREILARTSDAQRPEMEQLLRRLLGPTALESPMDEDDTEHDDVGEDDVGEEDVDEDGSQDAVAGTGPFRLGQGSLLLGERGSAGPSLLEGERPGAARGAADPLLLLGDPSRLRLGGGDDRLRLDLEPE